MPARMPSRVTPNKGVPLLILLTLCSCARQMPATTPVNPGWHVYANTRYGYEIEYPDGYELWETGVESERDGASIRIGFKDYEAAIPVLDVQIEPRTPAERFPTLGTQIQDMSVRFDDVLVNGLPAKQAVYRWTANNELTYAQVYLQGVLFQLMGFSQVRADFHETDWWGIISSFRFTRK